MIPAPPPDLAGHLADLFRETGAAHHQAFSDTDGADPEWPRWYARYLRDHIDILVGRSFTEDELADFFVMAEREHSLRSPTADWPVFYAALFVQRQT